MAYAIMPVEGDGELVSTERYDTVKRVYPVEQHFYGVQFSEDGKWLAFKEAVKEDKERGGCSTRQNWLFDEITGGRELSTWKKQRYDRSGCLFQWQTGHTHICPTGGKGKEPWVPNQMMLSWRPVAGRMATVKARAGAM